MATPEPTNTANTSLKRDLLYAARYYLGNRWGLLAVGILVLTIGAAFNWSWLVAAGIAPLLVSLAPCAIMCAVGLCCMNMKKSQASEITLKGELPMHMRKQTLILVAAFVAALVAAPALSANNSHNSSGSTRKDGMMGGGKMMGRSSQMMEGCGAMMQGGRGGRPNDQWRKNAPAQPDKDG